MVKNPNWQETDQLNLGLPGTTPGSGQDGSFKPATYEFQARGSNHLATLPLMVVWVTWPDI